MRHAVGIDMLSRYLDQRCLPEEAHRLERHLSACVGCKDDFIILRNSVGLLKNLEPLALPDTFDAAFGSRLESAIRQKEERHQKVMRRMPALVAVAASLVLVVAVSLTSMRFFGIASPSVIAAHGDVTVFDQATGSWKRAERNLTLAKGDIVRTAATGYLDISVPHVYSMRIKENAEVTVTRLTRRRLSGVASFYVKRGGVLVDIEGAFKGSQFKILTPAAEAKALGTKFVVDVEEGGSDTTWVGVLEGTVEVKSTYEPPRHVLAERSVIVKAGERTEVIPEQVPRTPTRLLEREWQRMQELYRIGRKPQVALLISTGRHRVQELLRPCPLYITDEKPRTIPPLLEEALATINEAIRQKDRQKHLEAIAALEKIVTEYPDPGYNPQFLLFIAAYYHYLALYQDAIDVCERVIREYPASSLASLAQCAIGVIYEENMHDAQKARAAYHKVVSDYPHSPETLVAKEALGSRGK